MATAEDVAAKAQYDRAYSALEALSTPDLRRAAGCPGDKRRELYPKIIGRDPSRPAHPNAKATTPKQLLAREKYGKEAEGGAPAGPMEILAAAALATPSVRLAFTSGRGRSGASQQNAGKREFNWWTPEEDRRLLTGVSTHGVGNWAAIRVADTLLRRNGTQMHQRYATLMRKKSKAENVARKAKRVKREADGASDQAGEVEPVATSDGCWV